MSEDAASVRWKERLIGAALCLAIGVGSWAFGRTWDHEARLIRLETRQDGTDATLQEIKSDTKYIKELLMRGAKP